MWATLFRDVTPSVLGALVRRYRDLAACEDALQEALSAAALSWPRDGLPDEPGAWLLRVASRRLVDETRASTARRAREETVSPAEEAVEPQHEVDDSLELLFLCCQPALSPASAIALTLRAVAGLSTAEIAHAFFVPEATMAQRLSRARQTVREAGVQPVHRPARLAQVMKVLYLVFNEGYVASAGAALQRLDLAEEALRLARLLRRLVPEDPEVMGLLALMLLTHARRDARSGPSGELVPLDEQDRARWRREDIDEGSALVTRAFSLGAVGPYQLQAAIAALHDEAGSTEQTDWPQVRALYEVLLRLQDSPLARLSHVIAVAMVEGPDEGLRRLDALGEQLGASYRWHAARAHLLFRAGRLDEAREAFATAAKGTANAAERDYLLLRAARVVPPSPAEQG